MEENTARQIEYLRSLLPVSAGIVAEIETSMEDNYVPIIEPEVAQLLRVLIGTCGVGSILEVGSAVGYSAIIMGQMLPCDGHITTIERYEKVAMQARENVKKAGLQAKIRILEGEAAEILPLLEGSFDMVFLDAAKGQYMEFLPHLLRVLRPGGLLVSDNVLYKGMVAAEGIVNRRKITIIKRLRQYLAHISAHKQLVTSVLPIGDGVAITYVDSRE